MFVFVEANVGAGKSTCLAGLQRIGFETVQEPVDQWDKHLEGVYGPRASEWGLPMQLLALVTRMERLLRYADSATTGIVVVERSLDSDRLFALDLDERDRDIYEAVRTRYETLTQLHESAVHIYLRASPETCLERAGVRSRSQEDALKVDRLRVLHDRHEACFSDRAIVLDASGSPDAVLQQVCAVLWRLSVSPE